MEDTPAQLSQQPITEVPVRAPLSMNILFILTVLGFWIPLVLTLLMLLLPIQRDMSTGLLTIMMAVWVGFAAGVLGLAHLIYALAAKPWRRGSLGIRGFTINAVSLAVVLLLGGTAFLGMDMGGRGAAARLGLSSLAPMPAKPYAS